jgi:hypothetical protein
MKTFNEFINEETDAISIYQIGRSKKNTIKFIKLSEDLYQVIYTENGGQYNKKADLISVLEFCADMIVTGGTSLETLVKKVKLISGPDVIKMGVA